MRSFNHLLVTALVVLANVATVFAYDFEVDGIYYLINPDSTTCAVTYNDQVYQANYYGDIHIPAKVSFNSREYNVSKIGFGAFHGSEKLTSIFIPNSIICIEDEALNGCRNLAAINVDSANPCYSSIDGVLFNKNQNKLVRYPEKYPLTEYHIPNGVDTIFYKAFETCYDLVSVVLPNSIKKIDGFSFNICTRLTSINLPEGLEYIGGLAFQGCSSLTSIFIPKSVTSIEVCPFLSCDNLTNVVVDKDNKSYSFIDGALYYNNQTELIEFIGDEHSSIDYIMPDNIVKIGEYSFCRNRRLSSVILSNNLIDIPYGAFEGCSGLSTIIIPNSVTKIGSAAFENCSSLKSVTISNNINEIDYRAFENCTSLEEVISLGTTPPSIDGKYVFENSPISNAKLKVPEVSLEAYRIADVWKEFGTIKAIVPKNKIYYTSSDGSVVTPNNTSAFRANIVSNTYVNGQGIITFDKEITSIGSNAFKNCSNLTSVTIPNSVTSIGQDAFDRCSGLVFVEIPTSVTQIGDYAFSGCTSLNSIEIPNSVSNICVGVFSGCSNLSSIKISNAITRIEDETFEECSSLTYIEIPKSVSYIGKAAFANCANIKAITCLRETPPSCGVVALNVISRTECILHVPAGSVDAYRAANVWKEFENIEAIIPNNTIYYTSTDGNIVTPNNTSAFGVNIVSNKYEDGQGIITFNGDVKSIGDYAFNNCSNLTSVTIPNSVTAIGNRAFQGCSGLTSVIIPNSVTAIGDAAFRSCRGLISVTIPNSVTSIGEAAFYSCSSLTSITIPNSVTAIAKSAFFNCSGLTSVTIPSSVTSIGGWAFCYCSDLTSVTIPNSVTSIGEKAFYACSNISSVEIPNSVTEIGECAFGQWLNIETFNSNFASEDHRCLIVNGVLNSFAPKGLTSYSIPSSVTSIGSSAFLGCSSLTSVTFPNTVNSIGNYAFELCTGLTSVTIPSSVTSIGYGAFHGCSNLSSFDGKFASNDNRCLIVDGELNSFAPAGLTSYSIPNSVTSIRDEVFSGCSGLTSVIIPNSVTKIGQNAFCNCSGLKSITIPKSVNEFGFGAFQNCSSLEEMILLSTTPPDIADKDIFIGDTPISSATLKVPAGSIDAYRAAEGWKDFGTIEAIGIPANTIYYTSSDGNVVTPYDPNAFGANIVSNTYENGQGVITFDGEITSISWNAFAVCTGLTSVILPNSVTSIEGFIFSGCSSLTSVTIPNSVTSIGMYAFSDCTGLTSIEIPSSVTSIGSSAFYGCSGLTAVYIDDLAAWCNIEFDVIYDFNPYNLYLNNSLVTDLTIPSSVTSIGSYAFYGCSSLTSVTIPNSVTSVGNYAFYGCSGLTSITIPESLTSIGSGAFRGCGSLTSVTIPNLVTSIGSGAFENCSSLSAIYGKFASEDHRCLIVDGELNSFAPAGLTSYSIPSTVTSIGSSAFSGCSGLTSVTIPSSVTSIGSSAFSGCSGLTSVTIPSSVTSIGSSAFQECSNLSAFYSEYASDDHRCLVVDGVLNSFAPAGLTSYSIPSCVTSIESGAFNGYSNLTSITIPTSVTNISSSAFSNCSGLTSVTIPSSVTSINPYTFSGCSGLKSVSIPNSVRYIGDGAFDHCISLESVTIPKSVNEIGLTAFQNCSSLKEVVSLRATPPTIRDYAFHAVPITNCTLKVPASSVDAYRAAEGWHDFGTIEAVIPTNNIIYYTTTDGNSVTLNSPEAFDANIISNTYENGQGIIKFDEEIATIGMFAFSGCSNLKSVEMPSSIISIGLLAFSGCSGLTSVIIPNSVISIGDYAFSSCTGLTSVSIPNSVTSIDMYAFAYCSSLESIEIPNSVTKIGECVFTECVNLSTFNGKFASEDHRCLIVDGELNSFAPAGLTSYSIPNSVNTIGSSAFSGCTGLTSVEIPNSVTKIGEGAFRACYNLTEITISNSVVSIGAYAFDECRGLTSVEIPKSVNEIGARAFQSCFNLSSFNGKFASEDHRCLIVNGVLNSFAPKDLTSYSIPNSVTSIGDEAFWYCINLTSIKIPNSVTKIGENAFWGCSGLQFITIPESVEEFGYKTFEYCSSLEEIIMLSTTPPNIANKNIFSGTPTATCVLKVPAGSVAAYRAAEGWGEFVNIEELPEEGKDKLMISDISGRRESTVVLPISLENENVIRGFEFNMALPNGVTISSVAMAERAQSLSAARNYTDGLYKFSVTSLSGDIITGNDGVVMNVTLNIDNSIAEGDYTIIIRDTKIFADNGSEFTVSDISSTLSIISYILGDVNDNGEVNTNDAIGIINYVIGKSQPVFIAAAADVNHNNEINTNDAILIINYVIGKVSALQVKAFSPFENLDYLTQTSRDNETISLALVNEAGYRGFQCMVELPDGVEIEKIELNDRRKNGHQIFYNKIENNVYAVAVLSLEGKSFNGEDGELFSIKTKGNGFGDVKVTDNLFFTNNGQEIHLPSPVSTSINVIESDTSDEDMYDLTGKKVLNNQNGIYIKNNKKVIIK